MVCLTDSEPALVRGDLSTDDLEVVRLQLRGDGSGLAVADDAVVHGANRHHFGGRSGQEGLVGQVQVGPNHGLETHFVAEVVRESHDGGLRNTGQCTRLGRWGRDDDAVAHNEEVLAGALRETAVRAEQDGFVVAGL